MIPEHLRTPRFFLVVASIAIPLGFAAWQALLNNFVIERAGFTGVEIGILQSLREVPGFLAFTAVFVLLVLREQTFAVISIALFGLGTALTGFFPFEYGLYCTAVLMSIGFHYFETVKQSLSLQWLSREEAPRILGKLIAVGSMSSLVCFAVVWAALSIGIDYVWIYLMAGGGVLVLAVVLASFPKFAVEDAAKRKHIVLRRRYWLYYGLTFLSGARRQIFIVFAGFLMVEKFGYSAAEHRSAVPHQPRVQLALRGTHRRIDRAHRRTPRADVRVHRPDRRLHRVRVRRQRLPGRRPVCRGPHVFRARHRHQDLSAEDRRSGGHRFHGGGVLHHQSHRRGDHPGGSRDGVDRFAGRRVPGRRGLRRMFA